MNKYDLPNELLAEGLALFMNQQGFKAKVSGTAVITDVPPIYINDFKSAITIERELTDEDRIFFGN